MNKREELIPQAKQFDEIISIIDNARTRALKAVNAELINMYWEKVSHVSKKVKDGGCGESIVTDFSTISKSLSNFKRLFFAKDLTYEAVLWNLP